MNEWLGKHEDHLISFVRRRHTGGFKDKEGNLLPPEAGAPPGASTTSSRRLAFRQPGVNLSHRASAPGRAPGDLLPAPDLPGAAPLGRWPLKAWQQVLEWSTATRA